jgi:RNA polymerase sigma-70 factor (ECF subfamily)
VSPSFDQIFERHFDAVYRYLARRVGADIGADLASETFVRAFEGRRRYDARRGEVRGWLFGIASNLLRRHYRDEERRLRAFAQLPSPASERPELDGRVAASLAALPPDERDVLLLFAWADLRYEEIAAALDAPVGTVRSRLHRARKRLREQLDLEGARNG